VILHNDWHCNHEVYVLPYEKLKALGEQSALRATLRNAYKNRKVSHYSINVREHRKELAPFHIVKLGIGQLPFDQINP